MNEPAPVKRDQGPGQVVQQRTVIHRSESGEALRERLPFHPRQDKAHPFAVGNEVDTGGRDGRWQGEERQALVDDIAARTGLHEDGAAGETILGPR